MKRIYSLAALLVAAFLIIATLVYNADFPNKYKNGFSRNYLKNKVSLISSIPTEGMIQDVCGVTASRFFFSTGNPEKIISTNHLFQDKKLIALHINKPLTDFFTAVDSPFVYVYAFNIPAVITADINTGYTVTKQLSPGPYSNAEALGNNEFILRKLIPEITDQLFVKTMSDSLVKEDHLSELHMDGGMCTDGLLHYDHSTHLFTYLHYYNNQYIIFDSTLQYKNSGHTIDTFSHFRFELSDKIAETKHVFTSQGPDKMINMASCVYKGILYVHSVLKADNDDAAAYKNNTVIDTYNLQTNKYTGSFYLPGNSGEKINKLLIYEDILLVQCKENIYTYRWYPSF